MTVADAAAGTGTAASGREQARQGTDRSGPQERDQQPPGQVVPGRSPRWPHRARRLAPSCVPALVMLIAGGYRAATPSLGRDEIATMIVARRTVGQIFELVGNVDGSIAPYYLFMHFWVGVFGTSEIALRVPSIIGTAVGVGLVGELGRRLFTPAVGLLGALLLAAVPLVSRYAQEARVYGITFMVVALSTLLFYRAVERPTWRRWSWYGSTVLLVGLAHMIGLTVLAGHAFAVASRWRQGQDRHLLRWLPVTAVALVLLSPLILLGLGQRGGQLEWIAPATSGTVRAAPGELFGLTSVAWLLIGVALFARWPQRWLVAELAVLALVPPAALLAESFVADPLWVPRYALFALAPAALLAAVALYRSIGRTIVVLAVVFVLAWPAQFQLRAPSAHQGPNMRYIAGLITRDQQPGDGIVYGGPNSWALRAGLDYYLAGRAAPRDLLRYRPAVEIGQLADEECPDTAVCAGTTARIWLLQQNNVADPLAAAGRIAPILSADYRSVRVWRISKGTIALYERKP